MDFFLKASFIIVIAISGSTLSHLIRASEEIEPMLIIDLKKGHLKTCLPTISKQFKSIGIKFTQSKVEIYCRCLGNFYFNNLTKREFKQMGNKGGLPQRIANQRRNIQEYCYSTHFE
jgi:hypothetical protein